MLRSPHPGNMYKLMNVVKYFTPLYMALMTNAISLCSLSGWKHEIRLKIIFSQTFRAGKLFN